MRIFFSIISACAILATSGCALVENRPSQSGGSSSISSSRYTPPPVTKEDVKEAVEQTKDALKAEIASSQNAMTQNTQAAVAASVGKVGEIVKGVEISLQNTFSARIGKLETSLLSNNELMVMLKNEMKVNAELSAQLQAQGSAQLGFQNTMQQKMEQLDLNMKAGRDAIHTEFTDQMLGALESANKTTVETNRFYMRVLLAIISAIVTIFGYIMHRQKALAEMQIKELTMKLESSNHQLVNVMGQVEPSIAREVTRSFPRDMITPMPAPKFLEQLPGLLMLAGIAASVIFLFYAIF